MWVNSVFRLTEIYLLKINWSGRLFWLYALLAAFAPAFEPELFEPLKELVCEPPPPPIGEPPKDPLLLNVWLPNGLVPEPDDDDDATFPPVPTFDEDEWLDEDVPLIPFGPSKVCDSVPLVDWETDPSFPNCVECDCPVALFPVNPFWLNTSAFVCEALSETPDWVCWCAFDEPNAWFFSPSAPIVCWVPDIKLLFRYFDHFSYEAIEFIPLLDADVPKFPFLSKLAAWLCALFFSPAPCAVW